MSRGFFIGDDRIDVRAKIVLGTAVVGIVFVAAVVVTIRDRAPAMDNHSVRVRFATTGCIDEVCSVAVTANQATGDWELWGGGGQRRPRSAGLGGPHPQSGGGHRARERAGLDRPTRSFASRLP